MWDKRSVALSLRDQQKVRSFCVAISVWNEADVYHCLFLLYILCYAYLLCYDLHTCPPVRLPCHPPRRGGGNRTEVAATLVIPSDISL
jgi:hypothetical protein